MRRIHPATAVMASALAITVGVAAGAYAQNDGGSGGAIANPTQQQALDANETVRNYIVAHPDSPPPTTSPTPSATATATPTGTATIEPTTPPPPAPRKWNSRMPWSDGAFVEHSSQKAAEFARWRGAPLDNIVAFTDRSSWRAQLNTWWAGTVPASFKADRDDFILSVPLWTDDKSAGSDQDWKELGTKIAAVDPDALVRLGWEMNCCFSHATDAEAWKSQFSRAVTLLRSTAPKLQIVFNPNEGGAQNGTVEAVESLYVEGKVDMIALDTYDWWPGFTSPENIEQHFTKKYGWNWWYDFARERGLPFGLGEFGVASGSKASGGDNPKFFEATYGWLWEKEKSAPGSIRFVSVFNESSSYCGCGLSDTDNPKAAAKYKALIADIRKR